VGSHSFFVQPSVFFVYCRRLFTKGRLLTDFRNMAQRMSEKEYCKFQRSRVD
jgi:hypothetical protein